MLRPLSGIIPVDMAEVSSDNIDHVAFTGFNEVAKSWKFMFVPPQGDRGVFRTS
jgi:hypothetical protein